MTSAVVVGSGPNGLTAGAVLARAGLDVTVVEAADVVGGGTTSWVDDRGVVHDHCSAVHPLALVSPVFRDLPLAEHGLSWAWPEVALAHPFDDGSAGVLRGSADDTAAGLGASSAWRRLFGPVADHLDAIARDVLQPILHVPRHPLALARFGAVAAQPAAWVARALATERARGLWAGIAAHAMDDLAAPLSAAAGTLLTAAGHASGWPVAVGGSQAIADALAGVLVAAGGRIETGHLVTRLAEVAHADVVLLDVTPGVFLSMVAADDLPARVRRSHGRWRRGPAAFKVDLVVDGGVPWTNPACRRAGTVHLGGTFDEVAATERRVVAGDMPDRPFVLVAQQSVADRSRSVGDLHPVWTYAHVPHGWTGDATGMILDQLERFAPGVRERIVDVHVTTPADFAATNPNFAGGDIAAGATAGLQAVFRPRPSSRPYASGIPGTFLCSAATPPGPGVHGMAGANAAAAALEWLARSA